MRLIVCVIRDSAADDYGQPYTFKTVGEAIRAFTDLVNNPDNNSNIFNHPDDFELYKVAEYDTATAEFFVGEPPRSLIRGADAKVREGVQRTLS